MELLSPFREAVKLQERAGLLRVEQIFEKPDARQARLPNGKTCVDFSSNSYLGLHALLRERAIRRFAREGHLTSAASSRMVSGGRNLHLRLEQSLAAFTGAEAAAVFGSGFLTCAGVVGTLAGSRDRIVFDEQCHASLRTGITLSGAAAVSYRHADAEDAERKISESRPKGQTFLVTDGLFSMNGDFAPVDRLQAICAKSQSWLVVDDAHGIGAIGARGRGTFEKLKVRLQPNHILIGTLSKTFASYGGFVAAARDIIRYLKTRSKEFIYTTAAPPFQVLVALEALAIVRSRRGTMLRRRLAGHVSSLGQFLGKTFDSPIVPVPVSGGPDAVLAAAQNLRKHGVLAFGMRYPTVPRGREMIRISLSAAHTKSDIRLLAESIRNL